MPNKLTNELIDHRLIGRNIQRITDYSFIKNNRIKIVWKCLVKHCQYIWKANIANLINCKKGCPNCAGNARLTNDIIDQRLEGRYIKRIDNFINSTTPIYWQCLKKQCNYEWLAFSGNVLINKSGCPKCARNASLNNEIVDDRLKNRNIKRVGNYKGSGKYLEWKCLDCDHLWKAFPSDILNCYGGCPACKNKKLIYKILKNENIDFEYQKNIKSLNNKEVKNYRLDFYCSKTKTAIEYNGSQHYQIERFNNISKEEAKFNLEKQKIRDIYIDKFCNDNNITLIIIDGRKYSNIVLRELIISDLLPMLPLIE